MNWTHRRPFRQQFVCGGGIKKMSTNRPLISGEDLNIENEIYNKPIDAIRLELADYNNNSRCTINENTSNRNHPYIRTFSDNKSSLQRTHSSIHSISTIQTDFIHQRVSTIHTYPSSSSSSSIVEQQQLINEDNNQHISIEENKINIQSIEKQSNQCRKCFMLIDIIDQQAQQISQQTDLIAKLARHYSDIQENIDYNNTEQRIIDQPTTT